MNTKHLRLVIAFISIFFMMKNSAIAQTDQKTADQWLKSKTWNDGIKEELHPSVNAEEFYRQYHANKAVWDKVFEFIKNQDLETIAPGKYPIDGENAYASITEAPSKEFADAKWESHRKYIDLQYVIKGEEKIGVTPLSTATVVKPYDETKDGANYTADGTYYIGTPETFFLFFPQDVHRPNIKVDGYNLVKKLVIKIKYVN
jgi:biofilm protein TabA